MPDVFDTLTDAPAHDIFDLVGPEDSPTPETDKAVAQTPSLIQRAVALAKTPSPEVLRKPEEAVRQYVKGMVPGDIKGALRMMNVPTDFNSPEQLTQFVFPMLQPAIQTLEGIKGRAAQIREAEKTPAGSQERWNAGIGTALDLAQLATIFKGGELIGERASTARPEGESATLTPPKAQTRPIQATGGLETPSGKLTREKIPIGYEFRAPNAADDFVMYRYEGNGEVTDLDTGQTHKLSQKQIDDTEGFIRTTPKYAKGVQPGPMYMLEPPASLASVYKPKPFEETTQTPQLKLLEGEPAAPRTAPEEAPATPTPSEQQNVQESPVQAQEGPSTQPIAEPPSIWDAVNALPPPKEGYVRLYRGGTKGKEGAWFSDSDEVAAFHFDNHSDPGPARLSYIDVPKDKAADYADAAFEHPDVLSGKTIAEGGDHVLPPELANQARTILETSTQGEPNAQQPSNAQVESGDTALGVEARPQGAEPQAGSSDNVVGETGGEKPIVEGAPPQEARNDSIVAAASLGSDGKIYTGRTHSMADASMPKGVTAVDTEGDVAFVTKSGRVVSTETARRIAVQSGRITGGEIPDSKKLLTEWTGKPNVAVTQPEGGGEPAPAAVSGAETPPAAEPPRSVTSLQNAVTEAERVNRGLGPRETTESQSWDKAKSIAQSEAATDPGKGARLVEELNQQPRALDDVEGVHLLNRKVEVNREFDNALENLRRNPEDVDAIARMTKAREEAYKMYQATEASGTAWGRGGRIRQAMMADDYSMSRMEATRRVANKGKPLSTSQMMEVADHYSKISKQEARIKVAEDSLQTPSGRMRPQEILNAVEQMKRRLTPCL